ncbi:hypothetical protein H0266_10465 [Halobacillus locisalis]|uniref:Uncharacterized protein n=1 Tax=Halobacillus locisalis TaxID=220753 RepID=A0A838CU36_9BACI|nr:hypothetical protein [Halobacillus locisalis]MBA2175319.1 hypothetical protein [Halobacillus locisalis]
MKKNTPLKVMTASAIAATIAVPAVASSVSAAEVNIETVAIEMDGQVYVVTYTEFTDAYLDGEGEVYDLATEGDIVSFSTDGESYISYEALVDALFDADENQDTADVIAELEEDEDAMVPADVVADYVMFGKEAMVESVSANTDLTTEVTTVEGMVSNLEALELEEGETATVTVSVFANGDTSVDPAVVNEEVEVDADGMFSTTFTGLPEGDHVVRVSLSEDVSTDAEFSIDLTEVTTAVDAVNNATNQVNLLTALENDFFENVNADLIAEYDAVLGSDNDELETVADVQMEIDTVNAVNAVNTADTQVELLNALQAGQELGVFTDVREDYIVTYAADLLDGDTETQDSIQDVIDGAAEAVVSAAESALNTAESNPSDANIEAASDAVAEVPADLVDEEGELILPSFEERLAAVKVVNAVQAGDGFSQVRLLAALEDNNFERVNTDFISDYQTAITADDLTVEDIQEEIDTVNFNAAETAVNALTVDSSADDFADAEELISNLAADEEDETAVSDLTAQFNLTEALAEAASVDGNSSNSDIISALTSLSELTEDFDVDTVTDSQLNQIAVEIDGATITSAADIQTIVETVAVNEVLALDANSTEAEISEALNALAQASEDFDEDSINSGLLEEYVTQFGNDNPSDAAGIQTSVDTANNTAAAAPLAVISSDDGSGNINATDEELLEALQSPFIDLKGVNEDLFTDYKAALNALGSVDRDEVSEVQAVITDVNNLNSVNTATTATEMRTALNKVAVENDVNAYINLGSAAKLEVAGVVLSDRADETDAEFATTADVTTAVTTEISARDTLFTSATGVNMGTISQVRTALVNYGLDSFTDLSASQQVEVAEYIVDNRPEVTTNEAGDTYVSGGYTTITGLETAIEGALAQ